MFVNLTVLDRGLQRVGVHGTSIDDESFLQDISLSSPGATSTTQRGTSKGRPTVVDTFRAQLQSLVDMLQATDVWYVKKLLIIVL